MNISAVAQRAADNVLDDRVRGADTGRGITHGEKQAAIEIGAEQPGLGDTVEQRIGVRGLVGVSRRQFGDGHRLQRADRQARKPASRRLVRRRQRHRQIARTFDEDRHDAGVGLHGDAGDGAKQPKRLDVRLDRIRKVDGQPPLALQDAHQPAADEDMFGVEGDGAAKFAPRLQPHRFGRGFVEDVQRVVRQQRQHQRRFQPGLVRDDVDDRGPRLPGDPDAVVDDSVSQLERHIEQRLGEAQAEAEFLHHADQQPGRNEARKQRQCQDHAAFLPTFFMPRLFVAASARA